MDWSLVFKFLWTAFGAIILGFLGKYLPKFVAIASKIAEGVEKANKITAETEEATKKFKEFTKYTNKAASDGVITDEEKEAILMLGQELLKEAKDIPVAVEAFVDFIKNLKK